MRSQSFGEDTAIFEDKPFGNNTLHPVTLLTVSTLNILLPQYSHLFSLYKSCSSWKQAQTRWELVFR